MERIPKLLMISFVLADVFFCMLPVSASELNFSATPFTPKSQIHKEKTYFDIQLEPNQKEVLTVEVRNDTDKEVVVNISLSSAMTNSNVVVEYGENEIKKDASLMYDISNYVEYPETVKLNPKSTRAVTLNVQMPEEKFDGVLAGGITFKEQAKEGNTDAKEQGLSIKNEYSYVVALLMRQTLSEVSPNLNLKEVKSSQINGQNVILANVQNDQKTYINQVSITTKITKKGSKEVLYQEEKDGLQIAPNTMFSFPTLLSGKALKAGEYHLSMTVLGNKDESGKYKGEQNGTKQKYKNKWVFEQNFKIDGKVTKKLNAKDIKMKEANTQLYILLGILFFILILLLVLWLIWRRKKNEKQESKN